jgi:hypothetical protein
MTRNVNLENPGPSLTVEEINAFEQEIGGRLPGDYKEFLLAHNGGLAEPLLGLRWQGKTEKIGGFDSLFPGSHRGLRLSLQCLREVNPISTDGFLPIASTFNEQDICLAYRGNGSAVFHTIYTYKTVFRGDLVPIDVTMAPLASSFTEFLDSLVEIPEPYCRIRDLGKQGTPDQLAQYVTEGNSIDAVGKNALTIVCEAVKFNNLPMIQACIEHGASLSGTLQLAVGNLRTHLIEILVQAGADVNERDEFGDTPLGYVGGTALPGEEGARNRELRELLIKLGATA